MAMAASPQLKAQLGMMKTAIGPMSDAATSVAADIEAGKFPDAGGAMQAFQAKMMQAMQGAMGGGPGPK